MHYGVDVSSNNPHPMAWGAICNYLRQLGSGATPFVVVKVNQGTGYLNPDLAIDVAQARANGALVAGYLMDQGNADPGAEEALFQRTTNLPQADDIELPEGLTVAQYIVHSKALVNIHPNELSYLNQSEEAEGFPNGWGLWLADYNNNPAVTTYPCDMHQYSSTAMIPGATGRFDMNAWTGSEARFAQFFGGALVNVPPPPVSKKETDMIVSTSSGNGYWVCKPDGSVWAYGDATWQGALNFPKNVLAPGAAVTGFAGHPGGAGYWISTSDGAVYAFGAAIYHGAPNNPAHVA